MTENNNEETLEISGYTVHVHYAAEPPPGILEQIENSLLENILSP